MPGNALPADQTIEGGGQIRVTQAGFQKLTAIIPAILNDTLESGFCLGGGEIGNSDILGADYCYSNQAAVTTGSPPIPDSCGSGTGCNVGINVDFVNLAVTTQQRLNMQVQLDVRAIVPLDGAVAFFPASCSMNVTGNNLSLNADLVFGIDPATGELTITLGTINNFSTQGLNLSNCGFLSDLGNLINGLLNSFIGEFVVDLLTPTLNDLVQGFLPDPLGIEGLVDIGGLVGGISPGTSATMEARMVPGGYVQLRNAGMSLGLITGLNSDEDTATRTPDLDSEPHYCVPPIPAPNFAAPPAALATSARGTFTLAPAEEFLGSPEPADDLVIGLSETTLDLAGHHAVTSGAMCLGVGTSLIAQLNLGTFSLLVPSLGGLGDSGNPVLMVTRPQQALDFSIGDGTEASPALTIGIHSFEVDIYVYAYERYTRAFTMKLDLDIGLNLAFEQVAGMPATVTPELVGLDADNITVEVLNSEFVRETPEELQEVLPTIFDLAVGLLGDGLGAIDVPEFAGFTLNNLRTQKVTTSEDEFFAIYASLGASSQMLQLADKYPSLNPVFERFSAPSDEPVADLPAVTVVSVDTPSADVVLASVRERRADKLPVITLAVDASDALGRDLEYAWRLGTTGIWRPYRPGPSLTISDRALAWQGKYDLEIKSRVRGDYTTTSQVVTVPVIIDSVGPEILVEQATYVDNVLSVPAKDIVSAPGDLLWAFGKPGDDLPWTDWQSSWSLSREVLEDLVVAGEVAVWVKDEAGNVTTIAAPVPFHGQAGAGGCSCDTTGGAPSTGALALLLLTFGVLMMRGRVRRVALAVSRRVDRRLLRRGAGTVALWAGLAAVSSLTPACNCGGDPGVQACEVTEDCTITCPDGEIPFCLDGFCVCTDNVPYGRIGPYSDVAIDSSGDAWVSAYAETHGDLVVARWEQDGRIVDEAWEFVDGVPEGPVVIPDGEVRGGIFEKGDDVGGYTSIAIAQDDTPMVTYFDYETGSLKFAAKYGGVWQIHTIDDGTGEIDPELGGEVSGLYTSLTLRADDGRPGVAYMAEVSDGAGVRRTEVRFAAAQSAQPGAASDWVFFPVDSIVLPPVDPENVDPTPIPLGLGLFLDATRDPTNQAPSIAYYDRANGDLKLARFDATGGTFGTPIILDGDNNTDVGLYPSLAIGTDGVAHVSYESASRDDLLYTNTMDGEIQMVDDGYRIVGTTDDGLPKPEYHFVGDDSNLVLATTGPVVVYQDATVHELLYSALNPAGVWQRRVIAGDEADFVGAYGFFASAVLTGQDLVISNWVIDQPHNDQWVEIHRERIVVE